MVLAERSLVLGRQQGCQTLVFWGGIRIRYKKGPNTPRLQSNSLWIEKPFRKELLTSWLCLQ